MQIVRPLLLRNGGRAGARARIGAEGLRQFVAGEDHRGRVLRDQVMTRRIEQLDRQRRAVQEAVENCDKLGLDAAYWSRLVVVATGGSVGRIGLALLFFRVFFDVRESAACRCSLAGVALESTRVFHLFLRHGYAALCPLLLVIVGVWLWKESSIKNGLELLPTKVLVNQSIVFRVVVKQLQNLSFVLELPKQRCVQVFCHGPASLEAGPALPELFPCVVKESIHSCIRFAQVFQQRARAVENLGRG
mmetsp:Transcript_26361/g.66489  ORF Transcript_26361/g.66489 Transcript_26361/m.66489 type:complete len:247 (+) Transcript_26361:990-1730(+)